MTNGRVDDEEDIRDGEASRDSRLPPRREEDVPAELVALRDRLRAMPESIRRELEPLVLDAIEQAVFRGRVLGMAREALKRLRAELEDHRQPSPARSWLARESGETTWRRSEGRAGAGSEAPSFPVAPVIGFDDTESDTDFSMERPESVERSSRWLESPGTIPAPTLALLDIRIGGGVRREAVRSSS